MPFPTCSKGTRLVGMDPTRGLTNELTGDLTLPPSNRTGDPTDELTTVTVAEAAELLGLSTEAVRMRVKRGTLVSTKIGGTVYVLLDGPNVETGPVVANLQEHNADLRNQVEHLRRELDTRNEELRRKDTIIMAMTQRIPELEAAPESLQSPVTAEERKDK